MLEAVFVSASKGPLVLSSPLTLIDVLQRWEDDIEAGMIYVLAAVTENLIRNLG